MHKYLFESLLSLLGIYLEIESLDHLVIPRLIFLRNHHIGSHRVILSSIAMAAFCPGYACLGKSYAPVAQGQATTSCITKPELLQSLGPGSRSNAGFQDSLAICLRPSSIQLYKNSCLPLDQATICCMTYQGENPARLS